jgi:hypothetical protein
MTEVQFWSEDSRFGVRLNGKIVPDLLRYCEVSAPQETGGILLGRYSAAHDCALVQIVTGAPADSKTGRTWFERGIRGLQAKLDLLWRRNEGYYLGEWHFHPFGAMRDITLASGIFIRLAHPSRVPLISNNFERFQALVYIDVLSRS